MPYELNEKIKNLTPYEPICGDYKIRLDANESYINIDFKKICAQIADENIFLNRYPDPYAVKLCNSFAQFYHINPNYITAGNGSDELISLIVGSFFTPKDKLLTLAPDFSMYNFYGSVYGIETVVMQKNDELEIDIDAVIEKINSEKIAGIIFSNPCNPTSLCINRQDVLKLVEGVNSLVVVDEAYMDFADQSVLDTCQKYDNLIVLKTCSKAVGLAAIRLGFAVSNEKITTALKSVKSPYNVNSLTQSVGETVLSNKIYLKQCNEQIIENRNFLYRQIRRLKAQFSIIETVYKTATNFVFIKTKKAKYIFDELLNRSIAIRFMGDYLRINTGSKEENEILISALEEILSK